MSYVLMRAFEEAPRRFDFWMRLVTFGRLDQIRQEIAGSVPERARILELGCGTGALAVSLAERGADVVGIDTSEEMLAVGRERAEGARLSGRLDLTRLSSLEIEDTFVPGSFDWVISVLMLSELSDAEVDCILAQCRRLLVQAGTLIIVDEVEPGGGVRRAAYRVLKYPPRLLAYLLSQAKDLKASSLAKKILYYVIELPLMLLTFVIVPPPSRPLRELPTRIARAGFRVTSRRACVGQTLAVIYAEAT